MIAILTVIHMLITVSLIGVILIQRSEGGGLGIGGGGGGMSGFMTGRGTASILTRATTILAAAFMCTSIGLTLLATSGPRGSIMSAPPAAPVAPAPAAPATPSAPVK